MTTPTIGAIRFEAPLTDPSSGGLYPVTTWQDATGPSRFLIDGVEVAVHNYGGADASGVWGAGWCGYPGSERKEGERPGFLDPFAAITVWAFDECDLTAPSQAEARARAAQNLRLLEPVTVEREFATRLLTDAGTPTAAGDLLAALAHLERELAKTNTPGMVHASPHWLPYASRDRLLVSSGAVLRTPGGHTWVFGGGYGDGLDNTLVATSPTYGWRDQTQLRAALDTSINRFVAVAERNVVVGYEQLIAAVEVQP